MIGGLGASLTATGAFAATVFVPTDQATVQDAVNAAGAGGTVIINSNATFDETVVVTQSVTIEAGAGFAPTIRGTSSCFNVFPCTLFFMPNSAAAQSFVVRGLRLLPKSGAPGGSEVVELFNMGSGVANLLGLAILAVLLVAAGWASLGPQGSRR